MPAGGPPSQTCSPTARITFTCARHDQQCCAATDVNGADLGDGGRRQGGGVGRGPETDVARGQFQIGGHRPQRVAAVRHVDKRGAWAHVVPARHRRQRCLDVDNPELKPGVRRADPESVRRGRHRRHRWRAAGCRQEIAAQTDGVVNVGHQRRWMLVDVPLVGLGDCHCMALRGVDGGAPPPDLPRSDGGNASARAHRCLVRGSKTWIWPVAVTATTCCCAPHRNTHMGTCWASAPSTSNRSPMGSIRSAGSVDDDPGLSLSR